MSHVTAATVEHDVPVCDPQRLDCYRVALEFVTLSVRLVPRGHRELRDQLSRASLSVPLNIAESCGRRSQAEKARFFAIARGSAMECVAIVDVARSLGIAPITVCRVAHVLLVRIIQMLTKLEACARKR